MPFFLSRQPVFTAEQHVWGYELLLRADPDEACQTEPDRDTAALELTGDLLAAWRQIVDANKTTCIAFSGKTLLDRTPYALPPQQTMILVDPDQLQHQEIVDALQEFRREGFQIGLDVREPDSLASVPLDVVDSVFLHMVETSSKEELEKAVSLAAEAGKKCGAKGVDTREMFATVKDLGVKFFQGFFFQKPENITGRKLTTQEITKLRLLNAIEQDDPDFAKLAEDIQADVSISYRLLNYLNSPFFGFSKKITSIHQAIVLMGWRNLRHWLRVVILTDVAPSSKTVELCYIAVLRAKFLELAAKSMENSREDPDVLFLMGLFSLLNAMLDTPMEQVVEHLPLEEGVKAALCGAKNNYSKWLDMAVCFEKGAWPVLNDLIEQLGLSSLDVSAAYYEGMVWSNGYFVHSSEPCACDHE